MARTNKYTSINFNDIYEKQLPSSATKSGSYRSSTAPSTSSSYSAASSRNAAAASNYKSHLTQGRMLVLSRPVPKPIAVPTPPTSLPIPDKARIEAESDPISLRPLLPKRRRFTTTVSCSSPREGQRAANLPDFAEARPVRSATPEAGFRREGGVARDAETGRVQGQGTGSPAAAAA